jgi:hypothetical protein
MPANKRPFKDKFELVDDEWKPKSGGGWQTQKGMQLPANAEPWLTNLGLWVFEMNQWAEVVNEELKELRTAVASLKRSGPPSPEPAPSPR